MKTIHIILFGIGNVGSTLIQQILNTKTHFKQQNITLKIVIITNSKFAFYEEEGVNNSWQSDFKTFSVPFKIEDIISHVKQKQYNNLVAIDTTASAEFVKNYVLLIKNGFHIVTANKIANTLQYDFYKNLRSTLKKHNKQFLYETNVGAALPVIETIHSIQNSGDKIEKIKGVFSGSLSYIFNTFFNEDISFSEVLKKAKTLGLTEPDAREDLSGNDVARKVLILAREIGLKLELKDVAIESLVPKHLNGKTTLLQFNKRIQELDAPFKLKKESQPKKSVLRYIGELDVLNKTLAVKLITVKENSNLGSLNGTDNIFEIFTASYNKQPLVIKGSGAGKVVTAQGVLSDVLKVIKHLN
ncbi:aspartate kinase [Lacinutrix salivirga]